MGTGPDFATAYAKATRAAGTPLPEPREDRPPCVVITVNDRDKPAATLLAQRFADLGFRVMATGGTARAIMRLGTPVEEVAKVHSPDALTIPELIAAGEVDLIVNTPLGRGARGDGYAIRRAAVNARVPCITTLSGATAAVQAMARAWKVDPKPLQELHRFDAVSLHG
jgi:carbamoyl-phosphate synthase large subunit